MRTVESEAPGLREETAVCGPSWPVHGLPSSSLTGKHWLRMALFLHRRTKGFLPQSCDSNSYVHLQGLLMIKLDPGQRHWHEQSWLHSQILARPEAHVCGEEDRPGPCLAAH